MTAQLAPDVRPACREDPEQFFPAVTSIEDLTTAAHTARLHCKPCPIRAACERDGLGEPSGIWGGHLRLDRGPRGSIDLLQPLPTSLKKAKQT